MTTSAPVVLTALRIESFAVRGGMGRAAARGERPVLVSGMGREKSLRANRNLVGPVLVVGFCGAIADDLLPGDVVVADEIRCEDTRIPLPGAEKVASLVRGRVPRVRVGPVLTVPRVLDGPRRAAVADSGAVAVDMESAYLLDGLANGAVIRAVVDTPSRPLFGIRTVIGAIAAIRALRAIGPAIDEWTRNQQKEVSP